MMRTVVEVLDETVDLKRRASLRDRRAEEDPLSTVDQLVLPVLLLPKCLVASDGDGRLDLERRRRVLHMLAVGGITFSTSSENAVWRTKRVLGTAIAVRACSVVKMTPSVVPPSSMWWSSRPANLSKCASVAKDVVIGMVLRGR
jgi:hypothetical protein